MQRAREKLLAYAGLPFDQDRYALAHKQPPALDDSLQGLAATFDVRKRAALGIGFGTLVGDRAADRARATESDCGYDEHRANRVAVDDNGIEPFGTQRGRQATRPSLYRRTGLQSGHSLTHRNRQRHSAGNVHQASTPIDRNQSRCVRS